MAFEVLVKRYERPLYGFIARQVGDRRVAQDLYQQTLLRILDRIETCKSPDAFKPWAFGIASNVCRNHHRDHRREVYGDEAHLVSAQPDPEQAAATNELGRRIAAQLGTLPHAQREVFVLYHYTHLSYDEIAAATGVPLGTVKSRMNAALNQLRSLLTTLGAMP